MIKEQAAVLKAHAYLAQGLSPYDGRTPVNLVESDSNNDTWINREYARLIGAQWPIGAAWCAMTDSVAAHAAGVLDVRDFSAGAWALLDHLHALGGFIDAPEPGCAVAYSEGDGHIDTMLRQVSGPVWDGGDGNWADRYMIVRRDMSNVPGGVYGYARFPGVQAAMNPHIKASGVRPLPGGLVQEGDSGQKVADLQLWLNRKRLAKFSVDGQFGEDTKRVVLHVEHGNQRKEDGKLTPDLRAYLVGKYGA